MRRALLATVAAALVALLAFGLLHREHRAFSLGVTPVGPAAELQPGLAVCQAPIRVPEGGGFDAVELLVGTYGQPGPPAEVAVNDAGAQGRTLGRGRLAPGYPDRARPVVPVGRVPEGASVEVCVRNASTTARLALLGSGPGASPATDLRNEQNELVPGDLRLVFVDTQGRAPLALLPRVLERATLFHGGLTPLWLLWGVLALLVAGVPLLLARALRSAARATAPGDGDGDGGPPAAVAAPRREDAPTLSQR